MDVHNFLTEQEVPHEFVATHGRFRSPERMAAVLDLPAEAVGKVVVYDSPTGPVAAVVPSGAHPDPAKVRRASRRPEATPATLERASELTGYLPESIPPVGLPGGFLVVLDRSLARDVVLYFPGGETRSVLKIRGKDLVKATSAKVASIAVRPEG